MESRHPHILLVDDDDRNIRVLTSMVESFGYEVEVARDGLEALQSLNGRGDGFDAVLMDVMMPGLDGFEVTRKLRERFSPGALPIVMVTALDTKAERLRAVEAGANDFVGKPVDRLELRVRLASALQAREAYDLRRRREEDLERTVQARTAALTDALQQATDAQGHTHEAQLETIHRLAVAAEYRDEDTAAHIYRISGYCEVLGRALGLGDDRVEVLRIASPMHDVGKIGIPDRILLKPGKLDPDEWAVMKTHTLIGARILGGSSSRLLQAGEEIALTHHERWDGTGYPRGVAGEAIPLFGRICAVADVFDALTSKRPYKPAFPNEEALRIIGEGRGSHLDPSVVDAFLESWEEVRAVQARHRDWQVPAAREAGGA